VLVVLLLVVLLSTGVLGCLRCQVLWSAYGGHMLPRFSSFP
jgi:hypothetical protein